MSATTLSYDVSCVLSLFGVFEMFLIFLGNIPGIFYTSSNFFLNFLYASQSVCWFTFLLKGPSFGDLKDQRGLQAKPPARRVTTILLQLPALLLAPSLPFGQI